MSVNMDEIINKVKFNERGLIPAVLQDNDTKQVLMLGYMNRQALINTIKTGRVCFWSRSRKKLWVKGETSGNYQIVVDIKLDCDSDALVIKVKPEGPVCHTGRWSCFFNNLIDGSKEDFIAKLSRVIQKRKNNPSPQSYTSYLFKEGIDKIGKKIGEESAEVIIAAKNSANSEIIAETADLFFHLLVLLNYYDISFDEVIDELKNRNGD